MGANQNRSVLAGAATAIACLVVPGCTVNPAAHPQQFRSYFLPPSPAVPVPVYQPLADPPVMSAAVFPNEVPLLAAPVAVIPKTSDTDFILRRADDRFSAGKKAMQDGLYDEARADFDKAIEILLTAPEDTSERPKLEKRLQEMVDAIYRYDAGELSGTETAPQPEADGRPIDELAGMTFPIDPSLRSKVREQIQATASQLPLEESDAVISYINYFSSPRGKKILEAGLRRSGRYKAMIERVLADEGVPPELIFLAQAESGFIPTAISSKLCVGLWQFIKYRGEEYGLQVTPAVDDRRDPEKATRAAAKHLHDLYSHFGDWYLAMAAYDCGPGCIDQRVEHTGYADFWTLRRLNVLPKETANYVPIILAMIIVSKNAQDYGLEDIEPESPLEYETVELESATSLALVANAVERPLADLKDLNPALLKPIAPAGYQLRIPMGTREALEQGFAAIPANQRDSWRLHRMETGETLAALAKQYGTTSGSIESANHGDLPEAGTFAAIPVGYPGDHPAPKRTVAAAKPGTSHSASARSKPAPKKHSPGQVAVAGVIKKPVVAQAPRKPVTRKPVASARVPGA